MSKFVAQSSDTNYNGSTMESRVRQITIVSIFLCCGYAHGLKLLGIFPMPGPSHFILANKLMKGLAEAGHDITIITPYVTKDLPKNGTWKDVYLEGLAEKHIGIFKNINIFKDSNRNLVTKVKSYQNLMMHWVNTTLFDPKVRALLTPDTKFDAVIMEQFFNDAHKYFAHYFQCPLILMSSMGPESSVNNIAGNPMPPSYIPQLFNEGEFHYEKFWHRLSNLYNYFLYNMVEYLYLLPLQNEVLQHAFPGAPSIEVLNNRAALILVNSHESLSEAVPLVPNMVEIGGYHIDRPKQLPKDLQEFLDNAKEGVIYFSLGSVINAKKLPNEKRQIFFNVFKKLKQKVLWKFEDEIAPGIPKNVLVKSWMPQQDILAHPNVKIFITHGGMLSTTETIYHGVPVLVIPVFADQFTNAIKAEMRGYGLKLPYNDDNFSEETLTQLLQELLTNPKYKENALRRSQIFHDRPFTPMESTVYWVEYVIRHQGAEHLKVAGAKLPLYQYLMLDVFISILGALVLAFYVIKIVIKALCLKFKPARKEKVN